MRLGQLGGDEVEDHYEQAMEWDHRMQGHFVEAVTETHDSCWVLRNLLVDVLGIEIHDACLGRLYRV